MSISTITISSVDYTSYASVAEADAYLAVDPIRAATWAALTTDEKGAKLIAATRRLDLLSWEGEKVGGASQANAWPRAGADYADGTATATDEVPQGVEDATILTAGSIALDSTFAQVGTSATNTKRLKAGDAEIEYFRPEPGVPFQDATAYAMLREFLANEGPATSATYGAYASGTSEESSFTDLNTGYGRNGGYS